MISFLADENYRRPVVVGLRALGYDVVTVQELGKQGSPDSEVLQLATSQERAVLTFDRRDYIRLHGQVASHAGIVTCTNDPDIAALTARIHAAVSGMADLKGQLLRVNRPAN